MRYCVINLTRFGDLLQTQAAISGLAASSGVDLVCLENFSSAANLLRDVSTVHALPGAKWLAGLDRDWRHSLASVAMWGKEVVAQPDSCRLVNLTPSLAARLLTRLLAREQGFSGLSVDDHGFGLYSDAWSCFLQVSSSHRGSSPFNMVDLLWRMAGLDHGERCHLLTDPLPEDLQWAGSTLASMAPEGCRGFVGFQLGASREERCWPEDSFARLGALLWEKYSLCPLLLGAPSEEGLAAGYADAADRPFINLVGKTTLTQLAALLKKCSVLVSNDTGTMHLGSGLGIPVVALFLATAQPWDTGPYHAGSICLEPDLDCHPCGFSSKCGRNHACRKLVPAETVFARVAEIVEHRAHENIAPRGARVWYTARDEHGYHDLNSLSGHEATDRTQWIRLQRSFYRPFLSHQELTVEGLASVALSREAVGEIERVLSLSQQLLFLLQEQSRTLLKMPGAALRNKVLGTLQRIQSLWHESRYFTVLGLLWQQQTQESGRDMNDFLELVMRYRGLCDVLHQAVMTNK